MSRTKTDAEIAAGKLISAIQKEWGEQLGYSIAEESESIMNLAHELLQARSAQAMIRVLDGKSARDFLGAEWVEAHASVQYLIDKLEQAITNESA